MRKRRFWQRIGLFTLAGLIVAAAGVAGFGRLCNSLIEQKSQTLRVQAEVIAAFLVADGTLTSGFIPPDAGERAAIDRGAPLDPSILAERVAPVLRRLVPPQTHGQVYSRDGALLVDTAATLSRGRLAEPHAKETQARGMLSDAWTRMVYWIMRRDLPIVRETGRLDAAAFPEVRTAMKGSAMILLVIENGEGTLYMVVPIQRRATVEGVLLLSTRIGI